MVSGPVHQELHLCYLLQQSASTSQDPHRNFTWIAEWWSGSYLQKEKEVYHVKSSNHAVKRGSFDR